MYELNRIRSAKAPVISAGVITANFNWNMANNINGTVGPSFHVALPSMPFIMKNVEGFPITPYRESPKARLNPNITQIIVMMPIQTKLCIMVESTFFLVTMPT